MKDSHPSESEIQEFVLNRSNAQTDTLAHLETCNHCRLKAEQYRLLFTGIQAQDQPEFDFNLSELVLASVSPTRMTFKWSNVAVYGLVTLGLLFIGVALIFFNKDANISFYGVKNMTLYLLLATTLVTAGFLILEIYRGYTRKIQALKFY